MDKKLSFRLKIGIVIMPLIFAWFTLKKGYTNKQRIIPFSWLALTILMTLTSEKDSSPLPGAIMVAIIIFLIVQLMLLGYNRAKQKAMSNADTSQNNSSPKKSEKIPLGDLASAFTIKKKINDPAKWLYIVKKYELTPDDQREICKNFSLTRPLIEAPDLYDENPVETDEWINYEHDDEKTYENIDDWKKDLTVLWADTTKPIEFTYEKRNGGKSRRKVMPTEVGFDGKKHLYIRGICSKSNEERTFKTFNFATKIKVGSQRFDVEEWTEKFLNIDLFDIDGLAW